MEVVDSVSGFLPLHVSQEKRRANNLARLGHVLEQDVVNAHTPHCCTCSAVYIMNALHSVSPLPFYDLFMAARSTLSQTLYSMHACMPLWCSRGEPHSLQLL